MELPDGVSKGCWQLLLLLLLAVAVLSSGLVVIGA
jgi:hypothetical protein